MLRSLASAAPWWRHPVLLLILGVGTARAQVGAGDASGVTVSIVNSVTGLVVPYADVRLRGGNVERNILASAVGTVRLPAVPHGLYSLRVRRVGFVPVTVDITVPLPVPVIRVQMAPLNLALNEIRIDEQLCPGQQRGVEDTAVVRILEQMLLIAERTRLMSSLHPFELTVERRVREQLHGLRGIRQFTDTVVIGSDHGWQYQPGQLVIPDPSAGNSLERLVIPQLTDIADHTFQATHCFRYRGTERLHARQLFRIDFHPMDSVRTADVSGSLYLDQDGYRLERTVIRYEHRVAGGLRWQIEVDTRFRDVVESLPAIDRVVARTFFVSSAGGALRSALQQEEQRVLRLDYVGKPPP